MSQIKSRKIGNMRKLKSIFQELLKNVETEYDNQTKFLKEMASQKSAFNLDADAHRKRIEAQAIVVKIIGSILRKLHEINRNGHLIDEISIALRNIERELDICREKLPTMQKYANTQLSKLQSYLITSEAQLPQNYYANETDTDTDTIIVPTELLYQAYLELFPAERMLVAAGRRDGKGKVKIGAAYDVTGNSHLGHVRADNGKMGEALIGMEKTGTHLALWLHSHPGCGPGGTNPSNIDINQMSEWRKNYSPNLLGVIFTKDGYIRFWGSSIENKSLILTLLGSGIKKEISNDNLYRF